MPCSTEKVLYTAPVQLKRDTSLAVHAQYSACDDEAPNPVVDVWEPVASLAAGQSLADTFATNLASKDGLASANVTVVEIETTDTAATRLDLTNYYDVSRAPWNDVVSAIEHLSRTELNDLNTRVANRPLPQTAPWLLIDTRQGLIDAIALALRNKRFVEGP